MTGDSAPEPRLPSPPHHSHDGDTPHDVVCPSCGEQGFDGRGHVTVRGTEMYVKGCWNCGTEFAVETQRADDD